LVNKSYKLLVVDVDGTLLNKKGTISAEDKEALARAKASGIQVSLSTGRVVQSSAKILGQLSLDGYHMFSDGALVYNPGKGEEVYVEPISQESVRQMVEYAHLVGIDFDLYTLSHFFAERETWATDIRRKFFGLELTIADFTKIWQKERIIKGTLVVASAEEKAKANDFYLHFKKSLNFSWTRTPAYPEVDFINVIAPDVSKGKALKALTTFLGISLTEVMAVGDGANDISLLSSAGLAVAMDNASDELKAVANYITLDVDHNGVAAAVARFLF